MSDVFYREYLAACAERDALRAELAAEREKSSEYARKLLNRDVPKFLALTAERDKLREALEPFAEWATFYDEHTNLRDEVMVPFADLHTARAVLEEIE